MGEAHKLEIAQFPSGPVQADKPAQFMVRKNGAKGDLDAKVGSISDRFWKFVLTHCKLKNKTSNASISLSLTESDSSKQRALKKIVWCFL